MSRWVVPLLLALVACDDAEERPQWLVTIASDAPVPQLGDRLRVDVLRDGKPASSDATREFDVATANRWPVSLGVVPPADGATLTVRARLYRTDHLISGELTDSFIDAIGTLPGGADPHEVALMLHLDCFGLAADMDQGLGCEPATAGLQPAKPMPAVTTLPAPGSWTHAQPVDCDQPAPAGMVCVPGGAFVLGSALSIPIDGRRDGLPEHLVVLSPFAIDVDEITVGQMKTLVGEGAVDLPPSQPPSNETVSRYACTYDGTASTANDSLPVNCVSFTTAVQACAALGKRLPTEAEWEYVAGNLQRESSYPWGEASDACERATVGVGRDGDELIGGPPEWSSCRHIAAETAPGWGLKTNSSDEDVTELGVRNLAGSVSEFVRDRYSSFASPCWGSGIGALFDPECNASDTEMFPQSLRGGSWAEPPYTARAYRRNAAQAGGQSVFTGFRCAADM
jgi:formylglycine-generating enzyme required for sulfatase activity